jgi:glycosyltransferase involved in cell wall biosynthesis
LKVAIPYPVYWPYSRRGVERSIHDLAGYLSRRGHQVHIITTTPGRARTADDGGARVTYLREVAHPLIFQYKPMIGAYAGCLKMTGILLRERPDVMHIWSYSAMATAPLLRRLGIPYLIHFMMPHRPTGGSIFEVLFRRQVLGANLAAALTAGGAADVTAAFGIPCEVLPPPVDLGFFKPSASRDPKRPVVLFTADLSDDRKGGALLLKAWEVVHRRHPRSRLLLAGPSGMAGWSSYDFRQKLEAELSAVADPAARAAIEVAGAGDLADVPRLYSEAAVTVLPSYDEAFGMVLTESMACGTPVVGSAHSGPGEIITNPLVGATVDIRDAGDLAKPERALELADAICHAIELSERPSTRSVCRDWAGQWSLDVVGARTEHLLARAMGQGKAGAAVEEVAAGQGRAG